MNVPFSGVVLGAFGTRFVKQAMLWPPDLHDEVSQCGVGFLLGQEVAGAGNPEHSSQCAWAPAVQTDFSSFLCVES